MLTPPHHFIRDFLNHPEKMETQAWIVIVADPEGKGAALAKTLELMNAKVDLVQTAAEAVTLMRNVKMAPSLLYILADEVGGLEQAMRVHHRLTQISVFGKCVILSNDAAKGSFDP
ncbi:MAG: type IV secretion system DNA-binding domain-containing protein, partial [Paracoccaceae bacterium]